MRSCLIASLALLLSACGGSERDAGTDNSAEPASAAAPAGGGPPFAIREAATFDEPWAMAFLPGSDRALITEKKGRLFLWSEGQQPVAVAGVPEVDYGKQGGFGDVAVHPSFATNGLVYLSWVEAGPGDTRGAVVGRGRLLLDNGNPRVEGLSVIWRQVPKVEGRGHFSHRMVFAPDGHLFISSGERQKFDPAQDMQANLGKIIRLTDTGGVPPDNPFFDKGGVTAQIWSLGHRNPLGLAFDSQGQLWENEMGPKGGDEFNLIVRGRNYGYPIVSNGDHYDGEAIPDHPTRPEFAAPKLFWNPSISPSSLIIYSGAMFPQWKGNAFMGALSGQLLVRIVLAGGNPRIADEWQMDERIREVEQGPDGAIWLLEDAPGGRLLKLTPVA